VRVEHVKHIQGSWGVHPFHSRNHRT
jgi:hypothetical protein